MAFPMPNDGCKLSGKAFLGPLNKIAAQFQKAGEAKGGGCLLPTPQPNPNAQTPKGNCMVDRFINVVFETHEYSFF